MITTSQACGCERNLIDISGVCVPANTTTVISSYPYWKQMYITESLQIPTVKPDIEQINSITASIGIIRKKVIVTPRSYDDVVTPAVAQPNLEGKLLSGRKLIIEGQICQQIEYTANQADQPVHSVHFYVPFSSYIVVPRTITLTTPKGAAVVVDSLDVNFDVNSCIEDITACTLDSRRILKQVTLMLSAVPIGTI